MTDFDLSKLATGGNGNGDSTDLVGALVGDGKKFKSVEDLAKGKLEADSFIERLQMENKALREAVDGDEKPDAVLDKIKQLMQSQNDGSGNKPSGSGNQSEPKAALTKDEFLALLDARERQKQAQENVNKFNSEVVRVFGEKTNEVVSKRLADLGMDAATFQAIAAQSSQAALRILGLNSEGRATGDTRISGSVDTAALFGDAGKQGGEVQNFAYFEKLRREMGLKYYQPEIQQQVWEARKKLGSDFWKS